ncbi:MAG: DUF2442 domain-containing protein [Verrucomicrobia bacterium]|nr:DUF2442 domain-containing protein [Verrucomicrobiota bacterium]
MHYDVVSAKYLDGYRLLLEFADGKSGVVDFQKYPRAGGVFRPLANLEFFKKFQINPDFGTVCWGDKIDVAPETLYAEATGSRAAMMVAETPAKYAVKRKR